MASLSTSTNTDTMSYEELSQRFDCYIKHAPFHPTPVWEIEGKDGELLYVMAKLTLTPNVGLARRMLRKQMRYGTSGYPSLRCQECADNINELALYRGSNKQPFVFPDSMMETTPGKQLPDAVKCNAVLKDMNIALNSDNKTIPYFMPTLCNQRKLKHEYEIAGKSPEGRDFHHHIGYADNYHTVWNLRLKEIDEALEDISPLMFQFIQKMINYAEVPDTIERLRQIKEVLDKETYGETFRHAVNWQIDILEQYIAMGEPKSGFGRIPLVVRAIARSNLGINETNRMISFDMQQANNTIDNFICNAGSKSQLQGLVRETLNPKNYKQRKGYGEDSKSGVTTAPSESHIRATQKTLGNFTIQVATLEDLVTDRPDYTWLFNTKYQEIKNTAAGAFDALVSKTKIQPKHRMKMWKSDAHSECYGYTSIFQVLDYGRHLSPNHVIQVRSRMTEAGVVVRIGDTDDKCWKVKGQDSSVAYSWSFGNVASTSHDIWCTLHGAHHIDVNGSTNLILVAETSEGVLRRRVEDAVKSNSRTGIGSWALSSYAERSCGQNLISVAKMVTYNDLPYGKTPIYGMGLCRNTTPAKEGQFHRDEVVEWRIVEINQYNRAEQVWPMSGTAKVSMFDRPKITAPKLVRQVGLEEASDTVMDRIKKLKALLDADIITKHDFETQKARILEDL